MAIPFEAFTIAGKVEIDADTASKVMSKLLRNAADVDGQLGKLEKQSANTFRRGTLAAYTQAAAWRTI